MLTLSDLRDLSVLMVRLSNHEAAKPLAEGAVLSISCQFRDVRSRMEGLEPCATLAQYFSVISPQTLSRIAFWSRELTQAEQERAARGIVEKSVPKGSSLIHKGEKFDPWVGVIDGLLKLTSSSAAGKSATLAGISSGGWFGEGSILKNEQRRYDVIALRESRIVLMDRASFIWLYENSAGFNRFLVRQLNERLGQFMAMVEQSRILDATGRVASSIAMLLNPTFYPDAGLHVKISQEEIGLLTGISRQSANSALRLLEGAGLIDLENGGISVKSLQKLQEFGQ